MSKVLIGIYLFNAQVFEDSNYFLFRQESFQDNTITLVNEYVNNEDNFARNNFDRIQNLTGEAELKRFKRVRRSLKAKRHSAKQRLRRSFDVDELNKLEHEPMVFINFK